MLMIQKQVGKLDRIPLATRLGLALTVSAGALDVAVHLMTDAHVHPDEGPSLEHLAHLLGIAGMFVVLAGVVISGARRQFRQRAARNGGFDRNATR